MIRCREMTEFDIAIALMWMKKHYLRPFPADFFPKTGVVALISEEEACIIPIYLEGTSTVAVLGHCIINEDLPKRKVWLAVKECIEYSKDFCRMAGKKYVVSIFGRNSINRIADRCGFAAGDKVEEKFYYLGGK